MVIQLKNEMRNFLKKEKEDIIFQNPMNQPIGLLNMQILSLIAIMKERKKNWEFKKIKCIY